MDAELLIAVPLGIVLLGGLALPSALITAIREYRRRGTVWRSSVLGLLLFALMLTILLVGAVRGCGQDCAVDPSAPIGIAFWNLLVWQLAVLGVRNWMRPTSGRSGSQSGCTES